jgi:hypothetical protein
VVIGSVVPNTALTVIAAVLAGVVATAGTSLLVGSWFVRPQTAGLDREEGATDRAAEALGV